MAKKGNRRKEFTFVAHAADANALKLLERVRSFGGATRIINDGDQAGPKDVAIFTCDAFRYPSKAIRTASHRLIEFAPVWAVMTPFLVAARSDYRKAYLSEVAEGLVAQYESWHPGNPTHVAPWNPPASAPTVSYVEQYQTWQNAAAVAYGPVTAYDKLMHYVPALFGNKASVERAARRPGMKLAIMGCPISNRPHTDIAATLVAAKVQKHVDYLIQLINSLEGDIACVEFIIPNSDYLHSPVLVQTLHPYYFYSLDDLASITGESYSAQDRLWGRSHARSLDEIAEALDYGCQQLMTQVVRPVTDAVNVEVCYVGWAQKYGVDAFSHNWNAAPEIRAHVDELYDHRIANYESWRRLDAALGREAGLTRLRNSIEMYLVEAYHLLHNPDEVIIDVEVGPEYLQVLRPELLKLWGDNEPYYGLAPAEVRYPLSY